MFGSYPTPDTKKRAPKTEEEQDQNSFGFRMKMPKLNPNTAVLSSEEIDKARLTRVSNTLYKPSYADCWRQQKMFEIELGPI